MSSGWRASILIIVAVLVWTGEANGTTLTLPVAVAQLAREKSAAESAAVQVKRRFAKQPAVYQGAEILYSSAKVSFDGLIAGLKIHLIEDRAIPDSPDFRASLERAVAQSQTFVLFARSVQSDTPMRVTPQAISDIIADAVRSVMEAAVSIWMAYRQSTAERRASLIEQVERLSWTPFDRL